MSGKKFPPITKFFHPVRESVAKAKAQLALAVASEQVDIRREQIRLKALAIVEATAAARELAKKRREVIDVDAEEDNADAEIASIHLSIDAMVDGFVDDEPPPKRKKTWNERDDDWRDIALQWKLLGVDSVLKDYPEAFADCTVPTANMRCRRWYHDRVTNKAVVKNSKRKSALGEELEEKLLEIILEKRARGTSIDDDMLTLWIHQLLVTEGRLDLYQKYTFGASWCKRFWKRHNLSSRKGTSKMRETIPAEFEAKRESYLRIGGQIFALHDIPRDLWVNFDETSVKLINTANRTRAPQGARRIRLIGIGNDKACLTLGLGIAGGSECLPWQAIWPGKTSRCLPTGPPPPGCIMTYTPSHWQTPATYVEYIRKVLIPWKTRKIVELGLDPLTQWTLLKHDLHYSHKAPEVLELCAQNNIAVLFVPGGCTDIFQELDCVANLPFKRGMRKSFRNYLHCSLQAWVDAGKASAEWEPDLSRATMKEMMTAFVEAGMDALRTPEMREVIQTAFITNGLFDEMKSTKYCHLSRGDLTDPIVPNGVEFDDCPELLDGNDGDDEEEVTALTAILHEI
jgi:hypothetical protein